MPGALIVNIGDLLHASIAIANVSYIEGLKWMWMSSLSFSFLFQLVFQLISNDRFRSVEHRVLSNHIGPQLSVACLLGASLMPSTKLYGPMKELVSENYPPKYRETIVQDYVSYAYSKGLDRVAPLLQSRL